MKRMLIVFACLLIFSTLFSEVINFAYDFAVPEIKAEGIYSRLIIEECVNLGEEGEPVLPYYGVSLLLPQGEELDRIEILSSERSRLEGDFILPAVS